MRVRHRPLLVLTPALLALAACGGATDAAPGPGAAAGSGDAGAPDEALDVVATTTQVQDFTRVVGGDLVDLTGVLPRGVEAHDFAPSPADVVALAEADVLVVNGVGLEEWLDATVESAGFDGLLVDTSRGVEIRTGEEAHAEGEEAHAEGEEAHAEGAEAHAEGEEAHAHGEGDPHIWHDPANAMVMVQNIADGLAEADPENADTYQANADAYVAELEALDAEVAEQIEALPTRQLVTNHEAFGYYTDAYGLDFVGAIIPSFDSSAELSGAEVTELVERIRETGTTAVFSESSLPPETAETVAREAGVQVVAGEDSLYGDSLGPEGSEAGTYLGMIRHNTQVIVDALGG